MMITLNGCIVILQYEIEMEYVGISVINSENGRDWKGCMGRLVIIPEVLVFKSLKLSINDITTGGWMLEIGNFKGYMCTIKANIIFWLQTHQIFATGMDIATSTMCISDLIQLPLVKVNVYSVLVDHDPNNSPTK